MNRIYFELYSRSEKVTIYSIRFEGSLTSETDAFVKEYEENGFAEDVSMIRSWIWYIKERGAQMRYFRPENNVSAGPVTFSKLRIYCIRCSENIVILDGGGEKKGQKTQDGAETWKAMKLMMAIDKELIGKIRVGDIHYSPDLMRLEGELFVDINMNELEKVAPDPAIHKFIGASFDIADRIHEILEKRGISQKELAEMLGKKESQVSKWMTGTHNFTIKTLALLEVKLGVSIFQVSSGAIQPVKKAMEEPVYAT